jgi:hypothetical protein
MVTVVVRCFVRDDRLGNMQQRVGNQIGKDLKGVHNCDSDDA